MDKIIDLLNYIFPKCSANYIKVFAMLIYLMLTGLYYFFVGICVYTGIRFAAWLLF